MLIPYPMSRNGGASEMSKPCRASGYVFIVIMLVAGEVSINFSHLEGIAMSSAPPSNTRRGLVILNGSERMNKVCARMRWNYLLKEEWKQTYE